MIKHFILASLGNINPFKGTQPKTGQRTLENFAFPAPNRGPGIQKGITSCFPKDA